MMQHPSSVNKLISELSNIPAGWALTPIKDKSPLREGWQTEPAIPRDELVELLLSGQQLWSKRKQKYWHCDWTGYGLCTGDRSSGLIAIDIDGHSVEPLLQSLSNGDLPHTPSWTSGKPGKRQLVYQLPVEVQEQLHDFNRAVLTESGEYHTQPGQILEFRYNRCQSALPPSKHPETEAYRWINSLADVSVATAPSWLCELVIRLAEEEKLKEQEQAERRAEAIETNPSLNPWDIRNFAPYLDGYNPGGRRRGWTTCKCPVHNGNSFDSLHINESTGQFKCHCGCDSKVVYTTALETAKQKGYTVPEQQSGYHFRDLFGCAAQLKVKLERHSSQIKSWGFGLKGEVEIKAGSSRSRSVIEYQPGERRDFWAEAPKKGFKYILDTSSTGTHKSYDSGLVTPELFEARQLFYLSEQHRNPTVPTLVTWTDLEARHQGLVREERPNGETRLRRAKQGEATVVGANCGRNEIVAALRAKNISGSDATGTICQTCPYLEACRGGHTYGFLKNRSQALKAHRLRAHPESLPNPEEYKYDSAVLLWDEAMQIFKATHTIDVTLDDWQTVISELAISAPQEFEKLRPLLSELKRYLSEEVKQPNKFGWNHNQIKTLLPEVPGFNRAVVEQVLVPDLDFLNTTQEYGVDLQDLPAKERKRFAETDSDQAEVAARKVLKQWLLQFLYVLAGEQGHLHINRGVLTITLPDRRMAEVAAAAKANIFLDATATPEDLALLLGVNPDEILHIRQAVPENNNLEVVQIATLGRMGLNRGNNQQQRVDALIKHILAEEDSGAKVIDFKRFTGDSDGKGKWWVDSRGSNDFEKITTLILVGTPCRNLANLEAEFTVLYGRVPQEGSGKVKYPIQVNNLPRKNIQPYFEMDGSADEEYREFVRRRILADIHQAIGRLRANRRPEEKLKVYFIGDYPLNIPVTLKQAFDITPEAGTKTQMLKEAIRQTVMDFKTKGITKITQQAIAEATKKTQGYISQFVTKFFNGWVNFKRMLMSLLESPDQGSGNLPSPEETWVAKEYIPQLVNEPNLTLNEVIPLLRVYGWSGWLRIAQELPAVARMTLLKELLACLPPAWQHKLLVTNWS